MSSSSSSSSSPSPSTSPGDNAAAAAASSASWDCLPSTSRDCMPSTSRDCMPSTSRDCMPSTSRQHMPSPSTSRQHSASTSRQLVPSTSRQHHLQSLSTSRQHHLQSPSTSRQHHLLSPSTSRQILAPWDHRVVPSTSQNAVSSSTSQSGLSFSLNHVVNGIAPTEINYRTLTLELDNVCRICLFQDENNDMFVNILENETLLNNIHEYYHIQVQSTDSRSKMICRKCILYIDDWHQRIKAAGEAQLIQDYLTKKAIEKAAKSSKNTSIQVIPDNEQVVRSLLNTGDEIYLQSDREMVVDHGPKELRASSSAVPTTAPLSCKTRSATLRLQNKKDTCIFCTGNNKHLKADFRRKLCDKHSKPHACLCENCVYVFPNLDTFLTHYRYHKNVKKNQSLCRVCFRVLNSSKREKTEHRHKSYTNMLVCCSMSFLSMIDLVLHRLKKHKAKIVMTLKEVRKSIQTLENSSSVEYVSETDDSSCENTDQLFTCLEPNCDKVFNNMSNNCDHYREHASVPEEYYLCTFCLNKFDSQNDFELQCSHISSSIICRLCNLEFTSLHDLAKHKLYTHNSVVLCGEDNIPGCPVCSTVFDSNTTVGQHYVACYNMETKMGILDNNTVNRALETVVDMTEHTESVNVNGSYVCKFCAVHFYSCVEYVEHASKKHQHSITIKDEEIKLCPLCDRNYSYLNFVNHVEICTLSMKIKSNNPSVELFGCAYCRTVFTVFSANQFRTHVLFCKSFQEHTSNGKKYFQCVNCTFKSSYHPKCVAHANIFCIYFQLKIKYAMSSDEKLKVEQRIRLLKEDCDDNLQSINIPPVVITIDHPANVLSDNDEIHWNKNESYCCNSTNFKALDLYNFLCKYCGNRFFDEYVFTHHLDKDGKPCRMNVSWYCTRCLSDFENEIDYKTHLSLGVQFVPVPLVTLKKELLAEDSTSELSDGDMENVSMKNNAP